MSTVTVRLSHGPAIGHEQARVLLLLLFGYFYVETRCVMIALRYMTDTCCMILSLLLLLLRKIGRNEEKRERVEKEVKAST